MGTSRRRRSRRRRTLAVVGLGLSLAGTSSFWLASTGLVATSISPPAGSPTSGAVADVTPIGATVTRARGAATLQTGVALAEVTLSSAALSSLMVSVAWTNVAQAAQVLSNPNAQISVGLYYTIHTGNCNTSGTGSKTDAPLVNLTDPSDSSTYCAALDQSATGPVVSSTGKLLLSGSQVAGYLRPNLTSGSISGCTSSSVDTGTWCQPNVVVSGTAASELSTSERQLFVIASIVTPGGIPQGQQPSLPSLTFYIGASAH